MTGLTNFECSALWKKFENKIETDWAAKYESIAKHEFLGLANIQSRKGKVVEAIWKDIDSMFKEKGISSDIIPNEQYFYSLVKTGISTSSHSETIETLVYYLGYDNIKSFTNDVKNQDVNLIGKTVKTSFNVPSEPILINKKNKISILVLVGILLCISISVFSYFWYSTRYFSKSEKTYFKNLIDSAGIVELNLYESSDTSRLNELDPYFTERGQARSTIFGEMDKTLRESRKLRKLQSHRRIIDWKFLKKNKEEVHVQTREKWKLVWFNPLTDKDISKYDTTNNQLYILTRESGSWKIDLNDYNGKKQKIN